MTGFTRSGQRRLIKPAPNPNSPIVLTSSIAGLHFVPLEDLVLFAASALGALEAADNKHSYSHCHQNGEHRRICPEPCQQAVHITFDANTQFSAISRRPLPQLKSQSAVESNTIASAIQQAEHNSILLPNAVSFAKSSCNKGNRRRKYCIEPCRLTQKV